MRKLFVLICLCLLAITMITYAQAPPPERIELTPWWDRPIIRDLGLSEDQLKQIGSIVRDSRDQLIQLRADVKIAEGHLTDAMSNEIVVDSNATNAIEKVVRARAELMRATAHMSLKIRKVLTPTQWQELRRRGAQRLLAPAQIRKRAGAAKPPL